MAKTITDNATRNAVHGPHSPYAANAFGGKNLTASDGGPPRKFPRTRYPRKLTRR